MFDFTKTRTRVECKSLQEARDLKHRNKLGFGGWVALENTDAKGRVFWYSYRYTLSEVLSDLPGSFTIQ